MSTHLVTLGKLIAQIRIQKNIQQVELAQQTGVSLRTLQRLEKGGTVGLDATVKVLSRLGQMDKLIDTLNQSIVHQPLENGHIKPAPERKRVRRPNKPSDGEAKLF